WRKVDAVLQGALELAPRERRVFLERACAGDEKMRREVEELIAADESAGSFIETPAVESDAEVLAAGHSASAAGQSIRQYKIIKKLGAGGMGEVYLASDTRMGRKVALKILPSFFTRDEQRVRRFQQEARAVVALNHPNIVTTYDIGESDGVYYIATEWIEGETLRHRVAHTRMTLGDALDVITQTASALSAAHEAGIVHRDIKPENVMLRKDGYVKVLDFGLAKLTEKGDGLADAGSDLATRMIVKTDAGVVMGTASYMSPEQARGLEVDARTDVWSLGVVLYEMLAGRRPFDGETPSDCIASILKSKPAPLSRYTPGLPERLTRVVSRALAKEREKRYQSVGEMAQELRQIRQRVEFEIEFGAEPSYLPDKGAKPPKAGAKSPKDAPSTRRASLVSQQRRRPSRKTINSLAVLPLVNVGADPSAEYLTDGITESIINSLSPLPRLRVMARTTVFRYKGRDVDPQEVGRELGVRAVLAGRVRQFGETLVIGTELIDVEDGSQLWGEQYKRKFSDIFEVQEEISREISEKLQLRLTGEERKRVARRPTENAEAYKLYLKGQYEWNKFTPEGLRKALEYFNQAIAVDPAYALAYA
ncbi:MAG TPA: serine/threonine-protein kinase, partial [Pyrinomonadaceae bacterium]